MRKLILFLCFGLFGLPLVAQDREVVLPNSLVDQVHADPTQALQFGLRQILALSSDGVVTQEVLRRRAQEDAAQLRELIRSRIKRYDINDDGAIDPAEIAQWAETQSSDRAAELLATVLLADADQDGTVSENEIDEHVSDEVARRLDRTALFTWLEVYDRNSDGTVTTQEVAETIELALRQPNSRERAETRRAKQQAKAQSLRQAKQRALAELGLPDKCGYPEKSLEAEIDAIHTRTGVALSTVATDGKDKVTTVADVGIEPGTKPIYLLLGNDTPMVWVISGATERVEHVLLPVGSAVQGLSEDRVTFLSEPDCLPMRSGQTSQLFADLIEVVFDQRNLRRFTSEPFEKVFLPSGQRVLRGSPPRYQRPVTPRPGGPVATQGPVKNIPALIAKLESDFAQRMRAGIREIDPSTLVLAGRAEPYDLMPMQQGLITMINAGDIWGGEGGFMVIARPVTQFPVWPEKRRGPSFYVDEGVQLDSNSGNVGLIQAYDLRTRACLVGPTCGPNTPLE